MKKLTVGKLIAVLVLAFLLTAPALVFPPYQPLAVTGPYAIGTAHYTVTDERRSEQYSDTGKKRRVNVSFWYPENVGGDETYPLVVFSHGGLATENSNESLYRELASHGYVVCSIGHPYHAFWARYEDGTIAWLSTKYLKEIQREDAKTDKQQSYEYYQKWMTIRTGDINFVIDTILTNVANGKDGVYGLVDVTKIGVMGHSLGGSAVLAIPRQRDDVDAVIALESPFLYDIVGVENNEFMWTDQPYPAPVLNVYSDSSWEHLSEWSQYARNYEFLSDASETAISLYLPGAGHFSLTDLSLASPLLVRILEDSGTTRQNSEYLQDVNQACLEFFNLYLK